MIKCWMGQGDCDALTQYTKDVEGLIVEIGAYTGISTRTMAKASPKSKVITIDPYADMEYINQEIIDEFNKNTKGLNVILITDYSQNVGKTWKKKIDFLHIDGEHSYEQVLTDIKLFVPHVKKGHFVFFHDYTAEALPGVKKGVDELKDKYFDEFKVVSGFGVGRKK